MCTFFLLLWPILAMTVNNLSLAKFSFKISEVGSRLRCLCSGFTHNDVVFTYYTHEIISDLGTFKRNVFPSFQASLVLSLHWIRNQINQKCEAYSLEPWMIIILSALVVIVIQWIHEFCFEGIGNSSSFLPIVG